MFGSYFYNQRIRKAVAVFGSLFNNIYVVRKNSNGTVINQQKVPLSYAPKRDFLARLDAMQNGEDFERQIAVKLPRMSFEITNLAYDPSRQLPKINKCIAFNKTSEFGGSATQLYNPVPYTITFSLNAYAQSQDDALQIVEQIMPYFTPHYTVTVQPLDDYDIKEDTPITLSAVTFSDDYESPLEARRTIIYTLDFDMKLFLYKSAGTPSTIITQACVNFIDLDNQDELFSKICTDSAFVATPLSATITEDASITQSFTVVNIPDSADSFTTSQPLHGTATASLTSTLKTINNVLEATGSWTYVPYDDYSGNDSFNVIVNGPFGTKTYPVSITIEPNTDAVEDTITTAPETAVLVTASTNDNWTSQNVVYSVAIGGQPTNGTVTVIDAATGVFEYTPNAGFTGLDSFVYRGTPEQGVSETAVINITVDYIEPVMGLEQNDFGQIGLEEDPNTVLEFDTPP